MEHKVKRIIHDIRGSLNNVSMKAELGKVSLTELHNPEKAYSIFLGILSECRDCAEKVNDLRGFLAADENNANQDQRETEK